MAGIAFAPGAKRAFLFLQGPSSSLFQRIASHLEQFGHKVYRINVCTGDRVFWRRPGATNYRGRLEDWPAFLEQFLEAKAITEIVMLGDERPRHKLAREVAARRGVQTYHIEMGYLRPDWLTIEIDGAGCNSHFPADPDHILRAGAALPPVDWTVRYHHSYLREVFLDVAYNLPNVFLGFLHPHYRWHAIAHPLAEYASYLRRFASARAHAREAAGTLGKIFSARTRYFLYPLQLETDYQLRAQSQFESQRDAMRLVFTSFAKNAPSDTHLVLKIHPVDNDLIDWKALTMDLANELRIGDRVHIVRGGDLKVMMEKSLGVVTVNSTVGIQAIAMAKPVKVLGTALYNIDRITDQRPLDAFWESPIQPNRDVHDAFIKLLASALHERGNFYSESGAEAGASAIARRINEGRVNEPDAYVAIPPRPRPEKIADVRTRRGPAQAC